MYYVGRLQLGWLMPPGNSHEIDLDAALGALQVASSMGNERAIFYMSELYFDKSKGGESNSNCIMAVNGMKFVAERSSLLTPFKRESVLNYEDGAYNRAAFYTALLAEIGLGDALHNMGWLAENG